MGLWGGLQMNKKILNLFLSFLVIVEMFFIIPVSVRGEGLFDDTMDGSKESPYLISSYEQLLEFSDIVNGTTEKIFNPNACARLECDIEVPSEIVWKPIGREGNPYNGTFDGNGHTVSCLDLESEDDYLGFFGITGKSFSVEKLGIIDSNIGGKNYIGMICGYNGGKIENCYSFGSADGIKYVGGICGYNGGVIKTCYTVTNIYAEENFGGICGISATVASTTGEPNLEASVSFCYYDNQISGGINGEDIVDCAQGLTEIQMTGISVDKSIVSDSKKWRAQNMMKGFSFYPEEGSVWYNKDDVKDDNIEYLYYPGFSESTCPETKRISTEVIKWNKVGNLSWACIESTLSFMGSGTIDNSVNVDNLWERYSDDIKNIYIKQSDLGRIVVSGGVFKRFPNLTSVTIIGNVDVKSSAFTECNNIKHVAFGLDDSKSDINVEVNAFANVNTLEPEIDGLPGSKFNLNNNFRVIHAPEYLQGKVAINGVEVIYYGDRKYVAESEITYPSDQNDLESKNFTNDKHSSMKQDVGKKEETSSISSSEDDKDDLQETSQNLEETKSEPVTSDSEISNLHSIDIFVWIVIISMSLIACGFITYFVIQHKKTSKSSVNKESNDL